MVTAPGTSGPRERSCHGGQTNLTERHSREAAGEPADTGGLLVGESTDVTGAELGLIGVPWGARNAHGGDKSGPHNTEHHCQRQPHFKEWPDLGPHSKHGRRLL